MNGQRRLASPFAVQTALSPDSAAFAADELVSSDIMAGNSPLAQLGLCWTERSWALRRGVGGGGAAAAASTLLLAETAACWLRLTDKTALVVDARLSRRSAGPIQTQGYPYSTKFLFWIIQEFAIVNSEPIHNVVLQLGTGFEHCLQKSLDIFSTACHQFQK